MKSILSIDVGFKDIKAAYRDRNGFISKIKKPAILAFAPETAEDMPLLEKQRYFHGNSALMRDSKDILDISDYKSLEKTSPVFIYLVMKDLGITCEDVDIFVTGLSLAHVDYAAHYKKRITKFKIDKEIIDFTDKVVFLPQGVGAKYLISKNYPSNPNTYLIIDIGSLTIDVVDVADGQTRKENLKGYPNEGVIKITRALQDYILDNFGEYLSVKEVNEILINRKITIERKDYDLSEKINELIKEYSLRTYKKLKETYEREFKKYPLIYFVGGGAYYFDSSISEAIHIVEEPEYYNVLGWLYSQEDK